MNHKYMRQVSFLSLESDRTHNVASEGEFISLGFLQPIFKDCYQKKENVY